METTQLKVEGMDCNSCALSITKCLQKLGLQNVKVNFASGDVSFENIDKVESQFIEKTIEDLGYKIAKKTNATETKKAFLITHLHRFLFCLIFSLPLFVSHLAHIHWLIDRKSPRLNSSHWKQSRMPSSA